MVVVKESPMIDASANTDTFYELYHYIDQFEGTLEDRSDEDWIRVDLVNGETYEITLAGNGENAAPDTILKIFNSAGELLASNDDIDVGVGNLNSMLMFSPDSSGTFYISAGSYSISSLQDNSGDYVVTVSGRGDSGELSGGDGDDELNGGAGEDSLSGGAGADALRGDAGFDIARYGESDSGVAVSLLNGTGQGGDAEGDTLADIEALEGSEHADTLTGDDKANWLFGIAGNDMLYGGAGDDWLYGGTGINQFEGGGGADQLYGMDGVSLTDYDTASYESSDTGVEVRLDEGVGRGGHAEGDILVGIEGLIGSGHDDVLVGDGNANWLVGGEGNDILVSRGNYDDRFNEYMVGGPGADVHEGGSGLQVASYTASEAGVGVEVRLYEGVGLGGDAEGDTFEDIEGLYGSRYDDLLAGDQGSNPIYGFGGSDVIEGREADDFLHGDYSHPDANWGDDDLDGGEGNDTIYGGPGADSLKGGDGDDWLIGGPGADMLSGGPGTDVVGYFDSDAGVVIRLHSAETRGGYAQGDTFTNMETIEYRDADGNTQSVQVPDVERVHGSEHDDVLAGDIRDNHLYGLGGNDTLYGGPEGGDDLLRGGDGNDTLYGGKGADTLIGDAGADTLFGGSGIDTFIFTPGSGHDIIGDFRFGFDTIILAGFDNVRSVAELDMEQHGNSVVIDLSRHGGGSITVEDFNIADFSEADFML